MKKIQDTYCIQVDDTWHAVLGNHYPNMSVDAAPGARVPVKVQPNVWVTQRLCDQQNVEYRYVVLRAPTCSECLRVKQLMVVFGSAGSAAREQESDDDDFGGEQPLSVPHEAGE